MAVVYPNETVAARWNGALEARLRRAPLEALLRAQSVVCAHPGVSQDSDNIARATELIVGRGIAHDSLAPTAMLAARSHRVGHAACLVALALAQEILEPEGWRIAAQLSTIRLLRPWTGMRAAAAGAASAVREFPNAMRMGASPLHRRIMNAVCETLRECGGAALVMTAAHIALHLDTEPSHPSQDRARASERRVGFDRRPHSEKRAT